MSRILMYTRFERFWHWMQALLVFALVITGFEVRGSWHLFGFEKAADYHEIMAWVLVTLWIFAIFWHLTTGEWRQYLPDSRKHTFRILRHYGLGIFRGEKHPSGDDTVKITTMMYYYVIGIFRGDDHPFHMTPESKHNPLQRMAYVSLHIFITPLIWITGWAYLFYASWSAWGIGFLSLTWIALLHTVGAFAMLAFLAAHLYFTLTTSEKPFAFVKAMITGYEEKG